MSQFLGNLSPSGPITDRKNFRRSFQAAVLTVAVVATVNDTPVVEVDNIAAEAGQIIDLSAEVSLIAGADGAGQATLSLAIDDGAGGAFTKIAERTISGTIFAAGVHSSCALQAQFAAPTTGTYKARLLTTGAGLGPTTISPANHDGASLASRVENPTAALEP